MLVTKTKIIATIGPSTNKYNDLKSLHSAGMNVARINMSHASHADAISVVESIRRLNKKQSNLFGPIGILLDTQGPEIRTGINQSDIDLQTGDVVNLTIRDDIDVETSSIKINYKGLIKSVAKGSKISIDNGLLNFQVLAKDKENLKCKVLDGGKLGSKRHVNLPGVRVDLPSITKKDRKDINFGIKHNVSFIALSFVRSAKDVLTLRSILKRKKSPIKIIAKIENQEGLENIHEITQAADIVMVARGDLGIETNLADLPNIQRRIMYASAKWGRRSIVATHLLESMINHPTPTRAEVTDVANAIYEGSDAVMLSGETSIGKYPVQCIKMIKEIASKTEHFRTLGYEKFLQDHSDWQNIAKGARDLAARVNADAIVIITRSGQTANVVSNTKPFRMPIYAFTNNRDTFHQLSLIGGMQPRFIKSITNQSTTISRIKSILNSEKKAKKSLKFVFIAGIYSASHTDSIQIIST
ncbi:MAG: pyruvate kinase [SAR86 cluster bacterium]|jgi:pyruvate kinase|nr:pyruvate kinase [SAR86 cluster bacterium]|tara:strand:- start:198 stop:1610 length:1413 start_codon:yes stop_codon:yes gene_type:complete